MRQFVSYVLMIPLMLAVLVSASCSKKMSEKEHFTLAQEYLDQQNWEKAEESFQNLYEAYPDGILASKSLFMVGYINANHLNNLVKAREYYKTFIEKFSDHELVASAKYELEHLGKEADELQLQFQENANATNPGGSGDSNSD